MKHRTHKLAAKAVAAILCVALMLTACEMTTTEATVAEPVTESTVEPTEAPTETAPAESPAPAVEPTAVSTGYTYSELSQTMYAKSAVNVRDLPSTDGKKIGSLKASQEITVTGKCDQTGWYRFELNNTTGYVSDKYIVSEKPVSNVAAAGNSNTAGNQYASNTVDDTFGITEEQIENFMKTHGDGATGNTTTTTSKDAYFDRAMAEQVFAMVNHERADNGVAALTWDSSMASYSDRRVMEITTDFSHNSAGGEMNVGENIAKGAVSPEMAMDGWMRSDGHRANILNASYTKISVSCYYDGYTYYWVQNFAY